MCCHSPARSNRSYKLRLGSLLTSALAAMLIGPGAAAAADPPPCFGALSRDPLAPCRNPALRQVVRPAPAEARNPAPQPCPVLSSLADRDVCGLGVDPAQAQRTVALVGDSHAGMWRPALDRAARALGWTGVRIGHSSCPLSTALRDLPEPERTHCPLWKRAVFAWFAQHPEVSAVFVSELTGGSGVVPARGHGEFETEVAGYEAAWRRLPASVGHIVVIRDTPKARGSTLGCVERALAAGRQAARACANPRRRALDRDAAVVAARRLHDPRVEVLDLTEIFCGRRTCLPVIGGALVYHDSTHLTPEFAATLGEPLLRRLARLARAWGA
jgi:SGNH domain (fused to AT3 domains)